MAHSVEHCASVAQTPRGGMKRNELGLRDKPGLPASGRAGLVGPWLLEGPGAVGDMGAPRFLKRKCEGRSLGECHDGFLVAAMAGPRGQLR